jgi:hypothetical protein
LQMQQNVDRVGNTFTCTDYSLRACVRLRCACIHADGLPLRQVGDTVFYLRLEVSHYS